MLKIYFVLITARTACRRTASVSQEPDDTREGIPTMVQEVLDAKRQNDVTAPLAIVGYIVDRGGKKRSPDPSNRPDEDSRIGVTSGNSKYGLGDVLKTGKCSRIRMYAVLFRWRNPGSTCDEQRLPPCCNSWKVGNGNPRGIRCTHPFHCTKNLIVPSQWGLVRN